MIRDNSYDTLGITIPMLKNKLVEKQNTIIKSDDKNTWQDVLDVHHEVNDLCKSVYNQFAALRNDYNRGAINLVRYREHLKDFKGLLSDEQIKNEHLHAEEIASEVKRYL